MTRKPQVTTDLSHLTHVSADPFSAEDQADLEALELMDIPPRKTLFSWGKIALYSFAILLFLGFALWTEKLIRSLFSEYSLLGWLAAAVAFIGFIALVTFALREFFAIRRLGKVEHLREKAHRAIEFDDRKEAQQAVSELISFTAHQPIAGAGHKTMQKLSSEIIDGRPLIHLAEAEILRPLDTEARALILGAAKRVSIVTAVSPRALVDLGYVFYESARLIRNLAELYGCRPGKFGFLRILRRVMLHLAVTGTIALSDGLVQQIIGQGLAARLSARLGEGVVNGLMTTRIGIAAMDALRPFPFDGEKRPGLSDFTGDLFGSSKTK